MPLKEQLQQDLQQAMRAHDERRRDAIRMVRARITNVEIERRASLDDAAVLDVISKEVRERRESLEIFRQAGRQDLVSKEEAELAILEAYLPQQLPREEIEREARATIEEVGAQGSRDKGKVMPRLIAKLRGRADGRAIDAVVTELLAKL